MRMILYIFLLVPLAVMSKRNEIDSLKRLLTEAQSASDSITVISQISTSYSNINLDSSFKYATDGFKLAQKENHTRGLAKFHCRIAHFFYLKGDISQSSVHNEKALRYAKESNFTESYIESLMRKVDLEQYMGHNKEAAKTIQQALQQTLEYGSDNLTGYVLYDIGLFYELNGHSDLALEAFLKSIPYLNKTNNFHLEITTRSVITHIYVQFHKLKEAKLQIDSAIQAYEKAPYEESVGLVMMRLSQGSICEAQERWQNAMTFYDQALSLALKTGNSLIIQQCYHYVGRLHLLSKNYKDAHSALIKIDSIAKHSEYAETNEMTIIPRQLFLGVTYHYLDQPQKALKLLPEVLDSIPVMQESLIAYKHLINIYRAKKDWDKVTHYQNILIHLMDSTLVERDMKTAEKAELRFELERYSERLRNERLQNEESIEQEQTRRFWSIASLCTFFLILIVTLIIRHRIILNKKLLKKELEQKHHLQLADFKSKFFANITHELRTPLSLIQAPLESLSNVESDDKKQDLIQLAQKNGDHMLELINQLLDLGKIDAQEMSLNKTEGNIISTIKEAVELHVMHVLHKRQKLIFTSNALENCTSYDRDKIKNIVNNLISNAIKFTPEQGDIHIDIKIHPANEPKFLELVVKDAGKGIPEEEIGQIFDRYFQASNSELGTGIGLALTKELVKLMNGSIQVESKLKEGTTFCVQLPLPNLNEYDILTQPLEEIISYSSLQENQIEVKKAGTNSTVSINDNKPTLLIIEDNNELRQFLASSLESKYSIIQANDGKKGIEIAKEQFPDLIISDIMMNEMDGYQVCESLKKDPLTDHIPIILLTAKIQPEEEQTGYQLGADAYVTKPFNQASLVAQIQQLLDIRAKLKTKYAQQWPNLEKESSINRGSAFMNKVLDSIAANFKDETFRVDTLAKDLGLSHSQLIRKIKAVSDESPNKLLRKYRLTKARAFIESGTHNVSEAAYDSGFSDLTHFTKSFKQEFEVTPSSLRKIA